MIVSIFLAKALSLYLVILGLGLVLRKNHFEEVIKAFFKRKGTMFLGGWLALIIGILMVVAHPQFTPDWRSWITAIGYLSLLEGLMYLFVIDNVIAFKAKLISSNLFYYITGIIFIVLGVYLGCHGWLAG